MRKRRNKSKHTIIERKREEIEYEEAIIKEIRAKPILG